MFHRSSLTCACVLAVLVLAPARPLSTINTSNAGTKEPSGAAPATARYQIRFQTGNLDDAGTDADILLKIRGTNGHVTEEARFGIDADFERGDNKLYERTLRDVGEIASIEIRRTDSASPKPGWYCTFLRVKNTATQQGAVWFVLGGWVPTTWLTRFPTTPQDLLDITLNDQIYVNPATPGEAFVDQRHQGMDRDRDSLKDDIEFQLAQRFRPVWQFSEHEPAHDVRHVREPLTLFQVRPAASQGLPRLTIRYVFAMAEDQGYVSDDAFCGGKDWHDGDAEAIEFLLESPDHGVTWSMIAVNVDPPESGWTLRRLSYDDFDRIEWYEDPGAPADAPHSRRYHPKLFLSAGKHHVFFDPAYDDVDDSPYSTRWYCNDLIDRAGDSQLANLTSLRGAYPDDDTYGTNNVGESHDHLVGDFRRFWGNPPVVHACGHDVPRCLGSMDAWSAVDFMSDGQVEADTDGGASMRSSWIRDEPRPAGRTPAEYEIRVLTGSESNAGTGCATFLQLVGAGEETGWMALGNARGQSRTALERNQARKLWIGDSRRANRPLDEVRIARIRVDCPGSGLPADSWHVMSMVIGDETDPSKRYSVTVPAWIPGTNANFDYPVRR